MLPRLETGQKAEWARSTLKNIVRAMVRSVPFGIGALGHQDLPGFGCSL